MSAFPMRVVHLAVTAALYVAGCLVGGANALAHPRSSANAAPTERLEWKADSRTRQLPFKFCNPAGNATIYITYASYSLWNNATKVSGWYNVTSGACFTIWMWSSDNYTHYFLFSTKDKTLTITPREFELAGFRFTGLFKPANKSFCVDDADGTDISENLLNPGRATSCRGQEALTPFRLMMQDGYYDEYTITLPSIR